MFQAVFVCLPAFFFDALQALLFSTVTTVRLHRSHRTRLMQVWRSAGWPCRDGIEIDLLAARLVALQATADGRETLQLTEAGIAWLAEARQSGLRALSSHDRLAQRFAEQHLLAGGRIVWRELSLRAPVLLEPAAASTAPADSATLAAERVADLNAAALAVAPPSLPLTVMAGLWDGKEEDLVQGSDAAQPADRPARQRWRMARPDLFSVRNTSVEAYLQPMVHEIKFSRADLLSDLRHAAKRQAYEWLCESCYYVFPAHIAKPEEIPLRFGVWVLHGGVDDGHFELLRPARHASCKLPFAVWMALCKATPLRSSESEAAQARLGAPGAPHPQGD